MFERFSANARQSILAAQEEARALGNNYLGSEHLLLGLASVEEGSASQVLSALGADQDTLREALARLAASPNPQPQAAGELPFTPHAKRVLEGALREALALGHERIGTEHLLLGLMRDGEGLGLQLLQDMGIEPSAVREKVLDDLAGQQLQEAGADAPGVPQGRGGRKRDGKGLKKYARNLTELARQGKLDPVIGRDQEVERMMQILVRRTKSNPVLVGEPGVGKTAVVEGLAQRLIAEAPEILEGQEIYALDMGSLIAGTRYRGEFEDRVKSLLKEVIDRPVILFIDEIHTLVGAGDAEGALDAASILKPALARGEIQVIGATTLDEFRKYLEKDSALERRFQQVLVDPPSVSETVLILTGLRDRYEQHHKVRISDPALVAASELSDRYITERFLPDKAIDLIDEAASRLNLKRSGSGNLEKLQELRESKEKAIEDQDFEEAARLRDEERSLRDRQRDEAENDSQWPEVGEAEIAEVASMWTGVPLGQVSSDEAEKLLDLEVKLSQQVIGQAEAVSAISRALKRSRAGLRDSSRPLGSFLFLGPTGVGKTETARVLATQLFGDSEAMVRLDMSEYMEKHSVSRLVGAPPGYVGHGEGGQLTEPVRRRPYSVLLLDEIEKAHPDVANILLQLLEDGQVTDSEGRKVSFQNAIVIMTSNLGASDLVKDKSFGFTTEQGRDEADLRRSALDSLKKHFRPELLNRIDETVVFQRLSSEQLSQIVHLMLAHLYSSISEKGLSLEISDQAAELLAEQGYDPTMGARPLRRVIQQKLEDRLADLLLSQQVSPGDRIMVEIEDEELAIRIEKAEAVIA